MPIVVKVLGDLDVLAASSVRYLVERLARSNSRIVIDMGAVDWIDPLAIGVVLAAKAAVEAGGGDLRIARMTPFVRAILTRYGADEIFECYDSVEDACDSFGGLDDGARC